MLLVSQTRKRPRTGFMIVGVGLRKTVIDYASACCNNNNNNRC